MSSQKIRIRLKGYDHEVVDQSAKLIVDTAQKTGARVSGPIPLPTERNLYCVIRSPHKDKDSRDAHTQAPHRHSRPNQLYRRLTYASRLACWC